MKRLLLTRHAKSSWSDSSLRDIDRPLNKRGLKAAPLMGQVLKSKDLLPNAFLISPSKRTRMTAELLAGNLGFPFQNIQIIDSFYGATPGEVVHQARQLPDTIETALFLGHNPTWTMLCQRLTGTPLANLPTCGILVIEFPVDHWTDIGNQHGILQAVLRPKDYSSEV